MDARRSPALPGDGVVGPRARPGGAGPDAGRGDDGQNARQEPARLELRIPFVLVWALHEACGHADALEQFGDLTRRTRTGPLGQPRAELLPVRDAAGSAGQSLLRRPGRCTERLAEPTPIV